MVSLAVGSRALGVVVRSHMSFQVDVVCRDKVISCKAPAGPKAERVRVGEAPEHPAQPHSGWEEGGCLGKDSGLDSVRTAILPLKRLHPVKQLKENSFGNRRGEQPFPLHLPWGQPGFQEPPERPQRHLGRSFTMTMVGGKLGGTRALSQCTHGSLSPEGPDTWILPSCSQVATLAPSNSCLSLLSGLSALF